jgi:hypothetical protein
MIIKDITYIAEMTSGKEILIHGSFLRSAINTSGKIFSWRVPTEAELIRLGIGLLTIDNIKDALERLEGGAS